MKGYSMCNEDLINKMPDNDGIIIGRQCGPWSCFFFGFFIKPLKTIHVHNVKRIRTCWLHEKLNVFIFVCPTSCILQKLSNILLKKDLLILSNICLLQDTFRLMGGYKMLYDFFSNLKNTVKFEWKTVWS